MPSLNVLTPERSERLRDMMAQWWAGWSFSQIGRAHGVSYQRVHTLLKSVGCTPALRAQCEVAKKHGECHPDRTEITEAKVIMESAAWPRLTEKQRAVVAWLASGFSTATIAIRTDGSQSGVRNLFDAARWRVLGRQAAAANSGVRELPVHVEPVESPLAIARMESAPAAAIDAIPTLPSVDATPQDNHAERPEHVAGGEVDGPVDAAPKIGFDEPDDRESEPAIESVTHPPSVDDAPQSPPEISKADFSQPQSPPTPAPLERKPIRLSELRPRRQNWRDDPRWVRLSL